MLVPRSVDLLIVDAYVVTMDGERRVFPSGAIAIDGGRIVDVGPSQAIRKQYHGQSVMSGHGRMAMPGLIDTHIHYGLNLNFNKPPQNPDESIAQSCGVIASHEPGWAQRGADYVKGIRWVYDFCDQVNDPELSEISAEHYAIMAIRAGTTMGMDGGGGDVDSYARVIARTGLRGAVSHLSGDVYPQADGSVVRAREADTVLIEAEALADRWQGEADGRISFRFALFADIVASDALVAGIRDLAERRGAGVQSHSAAQEYHDDLSLACFGKRGTARMADLGLLGPAWLGIHMGYLTDDEIALHGQLATNISHIPSTSGFYGKGIMTDRTMPKLALAGANVVFGTDDAWNGSLIEEATRAFCFHKDAWSDTRIWPYYEIAEMLTIKAARATMQADSIGSLEAGKQADLIMIDIDQPRYIDPEGPLQVFIKRGLPSDVATTIVDGRVLMREREILALDEQKVKARLREAARRLWKDR